MKLRYLITIVTIGALYAFTAKALKPGSDVHLNGTWKLISGTGISSGVKTVAAAAIRLKAINTLNTWTIILKKT